MTKQLVAALAPVIDRVHRGHCWVSTADGPRRIDETLDDYKIAQHVAGRAKYGACPIAPGSNVTRLALLDLDNHDGALAFEQVHSAAKELIAAAQHYDLIGLPFKSAGGQGIHIYFLWDEPQDAYSVRETLRELLIDCLYTPGTKGLQRGQIEIFPKQNYVPANGYGSMFILPTLDRWLA